MGALFAGPARALAIPKPFSSSLWQPTVSCGILQLAGYEGVIPLDQCPFYPPIVRVCECQPGGTISPPSVSPFAVTPPPAPIESNPVVPTADLPLVFVGLDACKSSPCGICEGDCDSHSECESGLKCFRRSISSSPLPPGCFDSGSFNVGPFDFCYDDVDISGDPPLVFLGVAGCSQSNQCGSCEGDCDSDSDCAPGLQCFTRTSSSDPLPEGCFDSGTFNVADYDFCYGDATEAPATEAPQTEGPVVVSAPLTEAPVTESPISVNNVKSWIILQGYSSAQSLETSGSPQSMAAAFMVEDGLDVPTEASSLESFKWMERYVVVVFYFALNGPNWKNRYNFLEKARPTCSWFITVNIAGLGVAPIGASCDPTVQKVDALQFIDNSLAGVIPSELGLLSGMQYMLLQQHPGIFGELPDSLQSFSNLLNFDCIQCSLSGSIPSWIGSWQSIQKIALTENQFDGSLPDGLGSLSMLAELGIDDNMLTGDLSVLGSVTTLRFLYAEQNGFSETITSAFLQALTNLTILDISDNHLAGEIPTHLMGNPALKVFDIHDNSITSFPDSIPPTGELAFFALHGNPVTGLFPNNTITNLKETLHHLDLTSTEFVGGMPPVLGEMQKLDYLFMADTTFDAGPIPSEYDNLAFLSDFSLKHSGRTGTIPTWIGNLDRVILLDLDSNDFTGSIPTEIADMLHLQFLMLNRNSLDGEIPTELALVTDLQLIFLDHNSLTGNITDTCEAWRNLKATATDCGGDAVVCPCCQLCCNPIGANGDTECNGGDSLARYDPEWNTLYNRQGLYLLRDMNITDDP